MHVGELNHQIEHRSWREPCCRMAAITLLALTTLAIAVSAYFGLVPIGTTGAIALFITFGVLTLPPLIHMVRACCLSSGHRDTIPPLPEAGGELFAEDGLYIIVRQQRAIIYLLEPNDGLPYWRQLQVSTLVFCDLSYIQSINQLGALLPDQVMLYRHNNTMALWGVMHHNGEVYHTPLGQSDRSVNQQQIIDRLKLGALLPSFS